MPSCQNGTDCSVPMCGVWRWRGRWRWRRWRRLVTLTLSRSRPQSQTHCRAAESEARWWSNGDSWVFRWFYYPLAFYQLNVTVWWRCFDVWYFNIHPRILKGNWIISKILKSSRGILIPVNVKTFSVNCTKYDFIKISTFFIFEEKWFCILLKYICWGIFFRSGHCFSDEVHAWSSVGCQLYVVNIWFPN